MQPWKRRTSSKFPSTQRPDLKYSFTGLPTVERTGEAFGQLYLQKYKGKKLGKLDLHKWQKANSTRLPPDDDGPSLLVQSNINEAPLDITDNDVFTDVVQALIFGDKSVFLKIKALVDVETETALGAFAIRKIPAEGEVPVKRR